MGIQRKKLLGFFLVFLISLLSCRTTSNTGDELSGGFNINVQNNSSGSSENSGEILAVGPEEVDLENPNLFIIEGNFLTAILYTISEKTDNQVYGGIHMVGKTAVDPENGLDFEIEMEGVASSQDLTYIHNVTTPDRNYVYSPKLGCLALDTDEFDISNIPFSDQDGMLIGTAQKIEKSIMVNGVLTDKYELSENNINFDNIENGDVFEFIEGSIWMAREGYLIRLEMTGTGTSTTLTGETELFGDIFYEINFTLVPGPLVINPPEECDLDASGNLKSSLPLTDDAFNISSIGDSLLTYNTTKSVEVLMSFFSQEMQANGYTLDTEIVVGTLITMRFTKDIDVVNILAVTDDNGGFYVTIAKEN